MGLGFVAFRNRSEESNDLDDGFSVSSITMVKNAERSENDKAIVNNNRAFVPTVNLIKMSSIVAEGLRWNS